jgi:type II restriction/modification system DNA methylase subunit YeeA
VTPDQFIAKWQASTLTERAAAQSHFNDLCALLDEPTPTDADPTGAEYAFERGASKSAGGEGWADVWKRGHFAWEYKGKRKDLRAAYAQLQQYAVALENPPLLVVSDMATFEIHTNWTNTVHEVHKHTLDDLRDAAIRRKLKAVFSDPYQLKPGRTRQTLTEEVAKEFAGLAQRLRSRGHDPERVAHFVNRLVFCMFAEDVGLLPGKMFQRMLDFGTKRPEQFTDMAMQLFGAMQKGGLVGFEEVAWFNGGLFDDDVALPMDKADIDQALRASRYDWAEIDPSILGTLFERGLDPDKRSQLGAHYTDRDKIMLIVNPVVVEPMEREWATIKAEIETLLAREKKASTPGAATRAHNEAQGLYADFIDRLARFRVLDPACGSGNFLYLALLSLKDLEHRVNLEAEALGFQRRFPEVGPQAVLGIEINPYAAELARVSVWIGEIQWMLRNGFAVSKNPILKPLDNIECRDAVLSADAAEAMWPAADAIIGNPPFLGDKSMLGMLGEAYTTALRRAYASRVPGSADLVCYWFEKARQGIVSGDASRAGFVATQAIRRGASRVVLDAIADQLTIYDAWSDEPWSVEGAAVRVSLVCFARDAPGTSRRLDGRPVTSIHADLSSSISNLTEARRQGSNLGICFQGPVKVGAFDIRGDMARLWLAMPTNPNGRPNSEVLRPLLNGMDVTKRPSDTWIIDFGEMSETDASFFEAPFEHVRRHVKPFRDGNRRERRRLYWWQHGETVPGLRKALLGLSRCMLTPRVAKHRLFVWAAPRVLPDSRVNAIARDDDVTFGILHSRIHELWSMRLGGWHGVGNDPQYTPSTGFETFPFPEGLTPDIPAADYADDPHAQAIATAAARLNELRENWLNPADLVRRVPEVVPGYPDRFLPVDEKAAAILKKRTLTNLYNERPAWLANAHRDLDAAVAAAYGWPADLADDEVLARLLALNQERATASAPPAIRRPPRKNPVGRGEDHPPRILS